MSRVGARAERIAPAVLAELISLIDHDLRNPLSAIQSSAAFLADLAPTAGASAHSQSGAAFLADLAPTAGASAHSQSGAADDVADALSDVLLSCQELRHILDNFRALSHVLQGEPSVPRQPTALRDVVTGAVHECGSLAQSRRLKLTFEGEASPLVEAHASMLERVLANLVRNAVTHAPSGSVVRVFITHEGHRATVSIEDEGTVFESSLLQGAFSADGQLAAKSTRGARYGRGLGLFTAAAAARAAGADLSVLRQVDPPTNIFQVALATL